MKKSKCQLIVCGPAVGKTYLAEHDSRFVDLDEMKAVYKYGLEDVSRAKREAGKSNRGKAVRADSFDYIIRQIEKLIQNNQIGLLSYNNRILTYVKQRGIPYCMVYPAKDARIEYEKRMRDRGNVEAFVAAMTNEAAWNQFYEQNQNDAESAFKIELAAGQYLSDIKEELI